MQLKLAFLNLPNLAQNPSPAAPSATAWQQLDEASLEILARLIARMLSARSKREGSDE